MKQTCALLLSLVLLIAQFALATPPCGADAMPAVSAAKHSCCAPAKLACHAACCAIRDTSPREASAPAAPIPASVRPLHFVATLLVAVWTLPAPAGLAASVTASSHDAASAPTVPLFLRHGALLI